ncbi:MAG TPA: OstA-like protein [Bacteroidales bacterium]|nr:OstA-like protein [Bacteroidales bacterium]
MKLKEILLLIILLMTAGAYAQKNSIIRLEQGNDLKYDKMLGASTYRVVGNVIFEHQGAFLYCDSAIMDEKTNNVICFGHVRIKSSDTLNLYGDLLNYNGDTKIADITGKIVKLVDNETTLTTDHLYFDRNTNIARYETEGKIRNKDNRLTSKKGYYHTDKKEFFFKDKVVLTNPEYVMNSDTLMYNTVSRTAFFYGPSTIKGKKNFIYCENGWYDTKYEVSKFSRNAYLINENQTLKGDSLYYDRTNGIGKALRNVSIIDTVQNIVFKGNLGDYFEKTGYAVLTDSAYAIMIEKKDSLFLHADTLKATFDTARVTKELFAFYHVKFFRNDLQGMCDSLAYIVKDSTLALFNSPILWSGKNQLTADTIRIFVKDKKINELRLYNTSFIVSKDTLTNFNQIKGKNMIGYFRDNQIYKVNVSGNSETLYWVREDDKSLIGISKMISSDMVIGIKENKVDKINYISKPKGALYPEKDLTSHDLLLKDFKWLDDKRPYTRLDIFKK